MTAIPYFDGHNDVLLRLAMKTGNDAAHDFLEGDGQGHLDLPRARTGGFAGGLFAMFAPPESAGRAPTSLMQDNLPPVLDAQKAWYWVRRELALFNRIVSRGAGQVRHCRTAADIRAAMEAGELAMVLHMEGAEAIEADLDMLHVLYGAGLRSLGPVWSRHTIFGTGVPMKFPGEPDIGLGLTPAGEDLVRVCNELRIAIDLSHLNEKGFWDVARLSHSPLIASHSNVHAICPSPRNLTDAQLDAIRESDGLVGLNFATGFLREDGRMHPDTDMEWMARHLDHLIERLGEDRVGLGSDFDGAMIPRQIGDVAGSQTIFARLRDHGYDEPLLKKLGADNWIAALARIWGA